MHYFAMHPAVPYDVRGTGFTELATSIVTRPVLEALTGGLALVYYAYRIKGGERADHIAYKYYRDERYDWLVYLANNIVDPYSQWPLDSVDFNQHLVDTYGSVQNAQQRIHHYEWILTPATKQLLPDGTAVLVQERSVQTDQRTYNTLPALARRAVDCATWEDRVNEAKRNIRLLDRQFLAIVQRRLREVYPNA